MRAAIRTARELPWRFLWVAALVADALVGGGVAAAQDDEGRRSALESALTPRIYLPLLASDDASAPVQINDDPTIGLAIDGNIDGAWSGARNDQGVTPVSCESIANSPDDTTNENVVRYGQPIGAQDCGCLLYTSRCV